MYWSDEGYLLSKNSFDENSIIIDAFTSKHGKFTGIVYGASSRKQKRNFQIGNKFFLNWRSKGENKMGYFTTELIKPVSPYYFDDKKKSICILSANALLKILLPERQINMKIYKSFERIVEDLNKSNWICLYIYWELSLIKELGFEVDLFNILKGNKEDKKNILINDKHFKIPSLLLKQSKENFNSNEIKEALVFNKNILMENFITPNRLLFPLSRNVLEKYFSF